MPQSLLDRISEIRKIDKSNMLSFCFEASKHYKEAARIAGKTSIAYSEPANIIVAGMGGSAIGGELLKDWASSQTLVPIDVNREYSLPAYANKKSFVLIASYSGETEESLSTFLDAFKRKCMIYCISSGGTLLEFAEKLGVPNLRIPEGMPPRAALPYLFVPMLTVLGKLNMVSRISENLDKASLLIEKVTVENSLEKPVENNFSKKLATNINGTVPVVYGFGIYRGVAQRFKQQFNENSKIPSKWEVFPELDHNEIVGWEEAGRLAKIFSTIFIRDKNEPAEIQKRIETTKTLMLTAKPNLFEVWAQGETLLEKMLTTITIGDFTSVYLAILRKIDPTPVRTIASLKAQMNKTGTKERVINELKKIAKK